MSKVVMSFELEKPKIRKSIAKPARKHKDKTKYCRKTKYTQDQPCQKMQGFFILNFIL